MVAENVSVFTGLFRMKIENYDDGNGYALDTFTFPYNSRIYDDSLEKFIDLRKYPYAFNYIGMQESTKNPRSIIITGHFSGTNKNTNYRLIIKHMNEPRLKMFYFGTDKISIVAPLPIKRTDSGGRTNFVDYVAQFHSPFSMLFSSTQKSGNESSAEENEGDVDTPIEKITGTVTRDQLITIKDGDDNGFKFTANLSGTMTMRLIKMISIGNGNYFSEYIHVEVDNGAGTITQQVIENADVTKDLLIKIAVGDSISDTFSGGALTNLTDPTIYFRDGYSSE